MEYNVAVAMARLYSTIAVNNLDADVRDAIEQGFTESPISAFLIEITAVYGIIDSWRARFDHQTPELDAELERLGTEIKQAEDNLSELAERMT